MFRMLPVLLTVLFIGLKLTGYINWSWVWVLAPFWVTVIIAFVVIFGVLLHKEMKKQSRRRY
jgi:hydrogenase/urease accessory protein HupE